MRQLVLPTVSVTTEDTIMKRISDFPGAPQPKRPTPTARPGAGVTGPCSALPVDIERLNSLDNAWTPPHESVWPYTERKLRRTYLGRQHISGTCGVLAYFARRASCLDEAGGVKLDTLQGVRPVCTKLAG